MSPSDSNIWLISNINFKSYFCVIIDVDDETFTQIFNYYKVGKTQISWLLWCLRLPQCSIMFSLKCCFILRQIAWKVTAVACHSLYLIFPWFLRRRALTIIILAFFYFSFLSGRKFIDLFTRSNITSRILIKQTSASRSSFAVYIFHHNNVLIVIIYESSQLFIIFVSSCRFCTSLNVSQSQIHLQNSFCFRFVSCRTAAWKRRITLEKHRYTKQAHSHIAFANELSFDFWFVLISIFVCVSISSWDIN